MNKYTIIYNIPSTEVPYGWSRNPLGKKFYRKNNWIILFNIQLNIFRYYVFIDKDRPELYLLKNSFLNRRHEFAYKNSLVWKAMHGEYDDE